MIERTLVLIKPDGIRRKLIGKIISRIEENDLKIIGMKMVKANRNLAEEHYPSSDAQIVGMGNKTLSSSGEEKAKEIFGTTDPKEIGLILREWLIKFITSSPVVALVVEGENAIERMRKLAGYTDPAKAEKGTIRGDFGIDSIAKANEEKRATENLVHVSGSKEEAEREVKLWFKPEELFE
ncbi:MAG: nucleoside-diphosphate kinase [Candidatus Njordarchaeales archaeon]